MISTILASVSGSRILTPYIDFDFKESIEDKCGNVKLNLSGSVTQSDTGLKFKGGIAFTNETKPLKNLTIIYDRLSEVNGNVCVAKSNGPDHGSFTLEYREANSLIVMTYGRKNQTRTYNDRLRDCIIGMAESIDSNLEVRTDLVIYFRDTKEFQEFSFVHTTSDSSNIATVAQTYPLYIGACRDRDSRRWYGEMRRLMVYDEALSVNEIKKEISRLI